MLINGLSKALVYSINLLRGFCRVAILMSALKNAQLISCMLGVGRTFRHLPLYLIVNGLALFQGSLKIGSSTASMKFVQLEDCDRRSQVCLLCSCKFTQYIFYTVVIFMCFAGFFEERGQLVTKPL